VSRGGLRADLAIWFVCDPHVGVSLLAMAAGQLTWLLRMYPDSCGSRPASDGGLAADPFFADVPRTLWELACQRWRPGSRPIFCGCTPIPVGAGLPAMAAWQPTHSLQVYISIAAVTAT
jgi:hypothetical protein